MSPSNLLFKLYQPCNNKPQEYQQISTVLQAFTLPAHHCKLGEILKQIIIAEIFSPGFLYLASPLFFFFFLKNPDFPLNCKLVRISKHACILLAANRPEFFLTFNLHRFVLHSYFLSEATSALSPFPNQPTPELLAPPSQATAHTGPSAMLQH